MKAILWFIVTWLCLSCRSTADKNSDSEIILEEDYGLTNSSEDYQSEVSRYEQSKESMKQNIPFDSSFPLAVSVNGSISGFDSVPELASKLEASKIHLRVNDCDLTISTANVQAQRFLYTGEWIKYQEKMVADSVSRLKLGMEFFVQFSSELNLNISSDRMQSCMKLLKGKKTFLGRYYRCSLTLLSDEQSDRPWLGSSAN